MALIGFCTVIFNQICKPGFTANDCFLKQQELRGKGEPQDMQPCSTHAHLSNQNAITSTASLLNLMRTLKKREHFNTKNNNYDYSLALNH